VPRKPDQIRVETDEGVFDAFQSLEVVNDIAGISEATFTIGDDGSIAELQDLTSPGAPFRVYCNDHLRLTGRAEIDEAPCDSASGCVLNLTVRTKMSDARYGSADPATKVESTSIKEFVLACYEPLGLAESDFVFGEFADVELITGKSPGAAPPVDLDSMTVEQAKVQPPETIYEAVERHLKRYRATHWDGPDGRIMVGRPDDTQTPLYRFQSLRGGKSQGNNLLRYTPIRDWSEVPASVVVYGKSGGKDITKTKVKGTAIDTDVFNVASTKGHFNRLVIVPDQQSKDAAAAERAARRELSARVRRKDAWELSTDGWTHWTGREQFGYAPNTTADIEVDKYGGAQGRYLIVRTALRLDVGGATTTALTAIAPGIWVL